MFTRPLRLDSARFGGDFSANWPFGVNPALRCVTVEHRIFCELRFRDSVAS